MKLHSILMAVVMLTLLGSSTAPQRQVDPCQLKGRVYIEKTRAFADYRVYQESSKAFADLRVFKMDVAGFATEPGLWYFTTNRGHADFSIYFESERGFADFSIYYEDTQAFAGCN